MLVIVFGFLFGYNSNKIGISINFLFVLINVLNDLIKNFKGINYKNCINL